MSHQGQLIRLKKKGHEGDPLWAYRYRVGGRESKRVQRGGFMSERDAANALERERMALSRGYRFDATQALRQVLARSSGE